MLFSFKKFISFFIEPLGLILTLGLLGLWFLFKHKLFKAKFFLGLSLLTLLIFSSPFVVNPLVSGLENSYPTITMNAHTGVKFVHILGFGHNQDKTQPLASRFSDTSLKRIVDGVLIYKQLKHPQAKLILTGTKPDRFEVSIAKMASNLAVALGVNPADIILGEQAKDTQEEAIFSHSIAGDELVIVVSSASHLPRVIQLFEHQGINTIPAPTNFFRKFNHYLLPNIQALRVAQTALHEYYGRWWATLIGHL